MNALITAAGLGTRMKNYTLSTTKALLPLHDESILLRSMKTLKANGIDNVFIVTGYKADQIENEVKDNATCIFNPLYATTSLIISVYLSTPYLKGKEFYFLTCDSVYDPETLKNLMDASGDICVGIDKSRIDEEGVKAIIEDDKIVEMSKKADFAKAKGEFIGMAKFNEKGSTLFFEALEKTLKANERGIVANIILQAQNAGAKVVPVYISGKHIEIDTEEDLIEARKTFQ